MKKIINIISVVVTLACYNNASGMLVKSIAKQPQGMQQRRVFCTMPHSHSLPVDENQELWKTVSTRNILLKQLVDEHRKLSKDIIAKISEESSITAYAQYNLGYLPADYFNQKENHLKDLFDKHLKLSIKIHQTAFSLYHPDRTSE